MVQLVTRAQWGARPPDSISVANWAQRDAFVQHYSAGPPTQTMRQIQNFHMDTNGWSDIGYNLAVDVEGVAYEGRGWNRIPAATKDHNSHTIACLFIGSNNDVTVAAKRTIRALYDEACARKGGPLLKRWHSYYNPTECPGENLRVWVQLGMPITKEGLEMLADFTPNEVNAWRQAKRIEALTLGLTTVDGVPSEHVYVVEALRDLQSRPAVQPAPIDAEALTTAFLSTLDNPQVQAKLVEIMNKAEDS